MHGMTNGELYDFGPIEYEGYALTGTYIYEAGSIATFDCPGDSDNVEIQEIFINGSKSNAVELIDPSVTMWMEAQILDGIHGVPMRRAA